MRLLGTEVLAVELHPAERPSPPAPPDRPCRFEPSERPRLEAGGVPHLELGFTAPSDSLDPS